MLSLRVMQSRMQWTRNGKKPRIPTTKQTVPHLVFVCGCLAFRNNKANFVSGITNHIFSIRLAMELARLERNRERRFAREKAKGIAAPSPSEAGGAGSPTSPAGSAAIPSKQQQGTQRKCANCGQVGHIKTNKKCAPGFPSHNFILVTAPAARKRKCSPRASVPSKRNKDSANSFTADPNEDWMFDHR
jgi:hypothetical protein